MKIVAIMGSPHGMQGNTGRLLEEVLAGVEEGGGEVELINLAKKRVQPCASCDYCHQTGECHLADDYGAIKDKLLACDGFILASPNYIFSVTAQMKALFDRCNGLTDADGYAYHGTGTFPYVPGCLRYEPSDSANGATCAIRMF